MLGQSTLTADVLVSVGLNTVHSGNLRAITPLFSGSTVRSKVFEMFVREDINPEATACAYLDANTSDARARAAA